MIFRVNQSNWCRGIFRNLSKTQKVCMYKIVIPWCVIPCKSIKIGVGDFNGRFLRVPRKTQYVFFCMKYSSHSVQFRVNPSKLLQGLQFVFLYFFIGRLRFMMKRFEFEYTIWHSFKYFAFWYKKKCYHYWKWTIIQNIDKYTMVFFRQ